MKVLAVLTVIFTAFSSSAQAQEAGTFIPTDCGAQVRTETATLLPEAEQIRQVCVGFQMSNAFDPGFTAVLFRMGDNSERVYEVVQTAHLLVALRDGAKRSTYYLKGKGGKEAAMSVIRSAEGQLMTVSGKLDGVSYRVNEFYRAMTVEGN